MRSAGVVAWGLGLAASPVLLCLGVYRVVAPAHAESPLCVGVDLPWLLAGLLMNLAATAAGVAVLRAGWWALGVAAPG